MSGPSQMTTERSVRSILTNANLTVKFKVRKNDFICHIKNTGMFGLFDKTDPESETHWQNVAITAFK